MSRKIEYMLKDRRELIEKEIKHAHEEAARMYLDIVTKNGDMSSPEYQALKDKIASLKFDKNIIDQLIYKGHQ